ncbi:type II and III secretion system protein family protein [Thioalbus denitrificans]|nr:pilus assembly protein N-terminal domain-containing protein [Thioalbus denitrificans]
MLLLMVQCVMAVKLYAGERTIDLHVGQTELLKLGGVTRVSIGSGGIADVKVVENDSQVLVIAKEAGYTDLRIWTRDGKSRLYGLRVTTRPLGAVLEQVSLHLEGVEGVRARVAGERIVLEGRSVRRADFERAAEIARQFPGVVNYVTDGGITLQGMILLDVKVVEVKKSELTQLGVDWVDVIDGPTFAYLGDYRANGVFRGTQAPVGPGVTAPALPLDVGQGNVFFGLATRITSAINLLVSNGDARLLAEPKLTCRSGGEAQFLAGGEVPIPITDRDGAMDVSFKKYGIILHMQPVSDPDGYVSTHLKVEVSTIDPSVSVQGIPGFLTRLTETDMNVREGETMVLSGLFSNERSKDVDKVPGLGHLPIIGELFKSRKFKNSETDLVVLVTPYLVDPGHRRSRELIEHARELQQSAAEGPRFRWMD